MNKFQQEIANIEKEVLNVYKIQKERIEKEEIRRNKEYKQRYTDLLKQSQYSFSMFGTGSFMERIGVTEEKMYNPMILYSIFSGENFEHLTCFISKLKEWQDRQFDYAKILLKIEIEDKIIEQENKRREIEEQIKKINDLEIKQLQGQNLTSKQKKDLNNSNKFIKSFNVVNYDDINKWEQNCKNKWLLEIKKNIDINRKKQLEQRKIADQMWECQLKEISGEFDNKLRCCNNSLQDTNKITLEGLAERLINSRFLDLEDQQYQEKVDLNNQANQNTVWTELRDLESRWWKKSDMIYADSLKLISQEMVGDIELIDLTSSPIVDEFDSQPSTSTRTQINNIELIDLTSSPIVDEFDSQPSTSTKTQINNIELIDLTSSAMDNTIFKLEAEIAKVAEEMLAQQEQEKQAREKRQQAKKEQHQIWKESKLVAEEMLAQQAKEKQAREQRQREREEQHQIWKESKLVAEEMLAQQAKEKQAREQRQREREEQHQIWKESELVAQQAREKRKRKLQEAQNQKTTGNEQYARVAPVSSILNNKYSCNKLGCSSPDFLYCSLTTGASTSTKVGDPIQTAPQAGTSFDRNTIFELEAETAKVAEQMLAQQAMERQARKQEKEEQARKQEKEEQERKKRSKEKRQQLLTE